MNVSELYKTLEKSDFSLIGYTFKTEIIKDEFISTLPHVSVGRINSSFSIKQYIRDYKINKILDNNSSYEEFKWIVIDTNDIEPDKTLNRINSLSDILERLRYELFDQNLRFKLLITSPMYKLNDKLHINNFSGGNRPLYMVDFAFVVMEKNLLSSKKTINIIKNRFGYSKETKVDISNLKNYNYICNKELIS